MERQIGNATGSLISPERLKTLADGVFAIVMTLLVLELSVPVAKEMGSNSDLLHQLGEMLPEFLIYALSFMIVGIFWVIHHSVFSVIRMYDTTLVWLNILFLMFVSLIPFSTALIGKNGFITVTAVLYGLNMLLLFNLGWITWAFGTGKRGLADENIDPHIVRGGKRMGFVYTAIMLPAIGMAFINPKVSFIVYTLFVVTFIIFTLVGRGETAMVLPVSAREENDSQSTE